MGLRYEFLVAVLMSLLLSSAAGQQTSGLSPQPSLTVPNATHMRVLMDSNLNTAHAKVGDTVKLRLLDDVIEKDAMIAPKGAKLLGKATLVTKKTAAEPEAQLAIIVEEIRVKRAVLPLHAFIVAQGVMQMSQVHESFYSVQDCYGDSPAPGSKASTPGSPSQVYRTRCGVPTPGEQSQALRTGPSLGPDVRLIRIGTPPTSSILVSQTKDIALTRGMVFLIRNAVLAESSR